MVPPLALQLPSFDSISQSQNLGAFIGSLYNLAIALIGLIIFFNFVYAGYLYLTSFGNASKAETANKRMTNAVVGVLLLISAYLIINVINPDLLKNGFSIPSIPPPAPAPSTILTHDSVVATPTNEAGKLMVKDDLGSAGYVVSMPADKLQGITQYTVDKLKSIKQKCNCDLEITGFAATETRDNFTIEFKDPTVVTRFLDKEFPQGIDADGDQCVMTGNTRFTCHIRVKKTP